MGRYRLPDLFAANQDAAGASGERLLRALSLLGGCNLAIIRALSEEALLADICRLVVDSGGYPMASIGVAEDGGEKTVRRVAHYGPPAAGNASIAVPSRGGRDIGQRPIGTAIHSGRVEVEQDVLANPEGYRSSITLPLISRGQHLAVLSVYAVEANAFGCEEVEFLGDLANNVAYAIEALRVRALNATARIELEEHDRKLAQQLAAAKADADRAKSRFLAAASHDLRQPLAALSLYVGALAHRQPNGEDRLLANMKNCVASLNEMLSQLLDLARLDAGGVVPMISDFAVDALVAGVVSAQKPAADRKKLSLRWGCFNLVGRTDPTLFRRIVVDLVANALRHTDRGGVLVSCRRVQGKVWVEVWDTGIGIAADKIDVVFDEFRQPGTAGRAKGGGLGFELVARCAALLGLQLRVRSRLGRGSLFAVELPLAVAAGAARPAASGARRAKAGQHRQMAAS